MLGEAAHSKELVSPTGEAAEESLASLATSRNVLAGLSETSRLLLVLTARDK